MSRKIVFIGAGSLTFTRKLLSDIMTVPELRNSQICFMDINPEYMEMTREICQRDLDANGIDISITSTLDRREAIRDAAYVVNLVRVGGLEAFASDISIPLKYGIDQCVGDTLCAGGIMYGQRGIPVMLDICRDIRDLAATDCLLLNYANPNAMMTWAANHYGGVECVGLCHGVQGGHGQIKWVVERLWNEENGRHPDEPDYVSIDVKDVDIICAGINHQTWYTHVFFDGRDWTDRLLEGFENHPEYSKTEKVRIDMIRNFGYYSTESNGHLSEYLPWYRKRREEIPQWIELSSWINGETGGYLRVCREGREKFAGEREQLLAENAYSFVPEERSIEHGSWIIEARETGRAYRGHFNVINHDTISNLPEDAIVEVPGFVDRFGFNIPRLKPLPIGCAAVCNASISVQRLAVEAAVHGDIDLLRQAMLMDPLTGAVCSPEEIRQLVDEMIYAQKTWLPQYTN